MDSPQHPKPGNGTVAVEVLQEPQLAMNGLTPVTGWRWAGMATSLCLGILLSTAEQSISATALVSIASHFNDFLTTPWVILAYLLGNIGMATVFARLSDVIGRKASLLIAWTLFAAFSLGAGLSQSLTSLIVCRAFQGVGGTGLYGMAMVVFPQITPISRWGAMSSLAGIMLAVASVIGPVLGGVITQRSTWRWVYLFNAPFAGPGVLLLLLCWPKEDNRKKYRETWRSIDVIGALFLITSSCLLVFALQQAGATAFAWNNPTIIASLVVAGTCWFAFMAWISLLHIKRIGSIKAVFPLSIALSKPSGPAMIVMFFTGFSQFVPIVILAERFQIVNAQTPIMAGVRLMPLLSFSALGAVVSGSLISKKNRSSELAIVGCCFVLLGTGLLSTLPAVRAVQAKQYGFQILLGFGTGIVLTSLTLMLNLANDFSNIAAAQGALNQMRQLGGSIGLAVFTIILNQKFDSRLGNDLGPQQLQNLKQSLSTLGTLSPEQRAEVGTVFADSFNQEMRVCMYIAVGALVFALVTFSGHPVSVSDLHERQMAMVQADARVSQDKIEKA